MLLSFRLQTSGKWRQVENVKCIWGHRALLNFFKAAFGWRLKPSVGMMCCFEAAFCLAKIWFTWQLTVLILSRQFCQLSLLPIAVICSCASTTGTLSQLMLVPFCSSFKAPQELSATFSISNIEAFIHQSSCRLAIQHQAHHFYSFNSCRVPRVSLPGALQQKGRAKGVSSFCFSQRALSLHEQDAQLCILL